MKLTLEEDLKYFCEPGMYVAVITEYSEETLNNGNDVIRIHFRFKDRDKQLVDLSDIFSYRLTRLSKLYKLLKAVGYEDCEVGNDIDLDDIIGKTVIIQAEIRRKGKKQYSNISNYKKYNPQRRKEN